MTLGWLRSDSLRPFYEADAGGSAGSGAGTESQADSAQSAAQAAASSAESTDLPEWAQKELRELRSENAKRRKTEQETQRKAAEETGQFKTLYEQTQAELKTLRDQATQRERESLLRKVAKDAGISEDLIDRLRGESEAELLADAKALAKRLTPTPPSTGATNPGAKRAGASEDEQIEAMFSGKSKRKSGMRW